jgi:hypothetical protein
MKTRCVVFTSDNGLHWAGKVAMISYRGRTSERCSGRQTWKLLATTHRAHTEFQAQADTSGTFRIRWTHSVISSCLEVYRKQ